MVRVVFDGAGRVAVTGKRYHLELIDHPDHPDHPDQASGPLATAREKISELLGRRSEPALLLLTVTATCSPSPSTTWVMLAR